jgi:CubicO group peptidase (beta-lactamase class C family)
MASAIPQERLGQIVRDARAATGVPAVAAGLLVDEGIELAADGPVEADTPFRIASITKWFTASLAALTLHLDAPVWEGMTAGRLLSHTANLRSNSLEPLPEQCRGLWSYSNSGFVLAGQACEAAAGVPYSDAVLERLLEPLGLDATSFDEPEGAAPGHVQAGETGHQTAQPLEYRVSRRPAGGLWSTVGDLLRFAGHQLGGPGPLSAEQLAAVHEPQAAALGARYCLGCWRRELAGGRLALDHEGSVGGYQSLLLLLPGERTALAVLTNSWRGSGLIRRVVRDLGLVPAPLGGSAGERIEPGRYVLDDSEAVVSEHGGRWRVAEAELDPLTRTRIELPPYGLDPLGGGVYGFADGLLMGHRVDFPRAGVTRVGWTALPRAGT